MLHRQQAVCGLFANCGLVKIRGRSTVGGPISVFRWFLGTLWGHTRVGQGCLSKNSHVHVDRICKAIAGGGVFWEIDAVSEGLGKLDEEQ